MKKIRVLALVMIAMMLVVASAQAAGSLSVSASYSGGKVSWNVSGWHDTYDVYVDGGKMVQRSANSGSYTKDLSAGTHTVKVVDIDGCSGSDTITVSGGEPSPVVSVEPSKDPVDEPTDEPSTKPSKKPSPKPSTDTSNPGDDVPKTGDATASTLVIVLMMVAAAAILVIRKFARNR
jgi:LPXTG-motif cell wall-anchored protein